MRRSFAIVGAGLSIGAFLVGCELTPSEPGKIRPNIDPEVFFLNTHASVIDTTVEELEDFFGRTFLDTTLTIVPTEVSYSTIISWYGTDSDGFIDHYEYAIMAAGDSVYSPSSYAALLWTSVVDSLWQTADATSDTVLFEAPTLRDRHRLWLRAVDDRGGHSRVKFADFLATTDPPTISLTCTQDDIDAGACPTDSVFALGGQTPSWPGITFSWEAEDPDGTVAGYVFWVDDATRWWTESTSVTLTYHLPAGDHTFYVVARDNAGAQTPIPARRFVHVVVPTFTEDLIIVADGDHDWDSGIPFQDMPMTNDQYQAFQRAAAVAAGLTADTAPPVITPDELSHDLLAEYQTIYWTNDNSTTLYIEQYDNITGNQHANLLLNARLLDQYLGAGGNLLFAGSMAASIAADSTSLKAQLDWLEPWFGFEGFDAAGSTDGLYAATDPAYENPLLDYDTDWESTPGQDPLITGQGARCGRIAGLTDYGPGVPLYYDEAGQIAALTRPGSHETVGATGLVLFPLMSQLPVFTDPADYTDEPWDILDEDQQGQIVDILRDVAVGMGIGPS